MGSMLQQGLGGTLDPEEGLDLWRAAAAQGHPQAKAARQLYAQYSDTGLPFGESLSVPGVWQSPYSPTMPDADQFNQQSPQYERLREIIQQYNSNAKSIIESIGR